MMESNDYHMYTESSMPASHTAIHVGRDYVELTCEHYAVIVARSVQAPMRLDEIVVCTFVWPNGEKCGWTRTTLGRRVGKKEYKARRKRELSFVEDPVDPDDVVNSYWSEQI